MRVQRTVKKAMLVLASALTFLLAPVAINAKVTSESISGTSPGFQTTVERNTEGELSEENLRQASLLSSQVLLHLNRAMNDLEVDRSKNAGEQIDKGLTLIGVVREMLPVTVETTVVKDPTGSEIYRHTERSQDDLIPIYQEMTAVEVVQPLLDVRWDRAAVEGVQLADVDLLETSVLADLRYIERHLLRAKELLKTPEDALAHLRFAHTRGLRFSVDKKNSPLLEAQRALRLAERMAEEENYRAAKANLVVAQNRLTMYRGLVSEAEKAPVKALLAEIKKLEGDLDEKSAGMIRSFWHRVTGWMSDEPGQAVVTEDYGKEGSSS